MLTPGQASDKTTAPLLLAALPPSQVVADRGHDSMALARFVAQRGGEAHIPTQKPGPPPARRLRDIYRQHATNFLAARRAASKSRKR